MAEENVGTVVIDLVLEDGKFIATLRDAGKTAETAGKQIGTNISQGAQKATDSFDKMQAVVKSLMYKLAALYTIHQFAGFIKETALAAARFETLGIVMTQVAKINGVSTKTIREQEMALRKQGISMTETRSNLTKMMQAQIDTAQASKLARIAQDAAVIGDINSSEAFARMIHGIKSGQTEVLRNIGLQVSNEAAYKKLAETLKITTGQLTENQKMQARVNAVMEEGAKIVGVYEAAMETAGKKLNSFKRYIDDFKVKMGEAFGPAMVILIDAATESMKKLQTEISSPAAQESMKQIASDLAKVVKILIEEVPMALEKVIAAFSSLVKLYNSLPAEIIGAAGAGLIGTILFGPQTGGVIAAITATLILLNRIDGKMKDYGKTLREQIGVEKTWGSIALKRAAAKEEEIKKEEKWNKIRKQSLELDLMSENKRARKSQIIDFAGGKEILPYSYAEEVIKHGSESKWSTGMYKEHERKLAPTDTKEAEAKIKAIQAIEAQYYNQAKFQDTNYYKWQMDLYDKEKKEHLAKGVSKLIADRILDANRRKLDQEYFNWKLNLAKGYQNEWMAINAELSNDPFGGNEDARKLSEDMQSEILQNQIGSGEKLLNFQEYQTQQLSDLYDQQANAGIQASEKLFNAKKEILERQKTAEIAALGNLPLQDTALQDLLINNIEVKYTDILIEEKIKQLKIQEEYYGRIKGFEEEAYQARLKIIELTRQKEINLGIETVDANKKASVQKISLWEQEASRKITDIKTTLGATASALESISQMYDEGSKQRERYHKMAMAFEVAEKAAALATAIVHAVAAVAKAASTSRNWVEALVAIAAVGGALAAVFSSAGVSFGGGGSSRAASMPASTVLGAEPGTASDSLNKSYELLQETYDMEYTKLSALLNEMKALNQNITGLVTNIIRTGSTSLPGSWTGKEMSFFDTRWKEVKENMVPAMIGVNLDFVSKFFNKLAIKGMSKIVGGSSKTSQIGGGIGVHGISVEDLLADESITGYTFASMLKKTKKGSLKGGGSKKRYWTEYGELEESTTDMLTQVYKNIGETLVLLSKGLGTDINNALNYAFAPAQWNFMNASAETINKTLQAHFSAIGDKAVEVLFGSILRGYQKVGEGLFETAIRLLVDKEIIATILEKTRKDLTGTIVEMIEFSEALIEIAGTLDNLMEITNNYYDKFFTDEEKQADLLKQLSTTMTSLNLSLPDTRAGYREVAEAIDLTTEYGMTMWVTMMQMALDADKYYSTLEDTMDDVINKQDDYVQGLKDIIKIIDDWLDNLKLSNLAPAQSKQEWERQYLQNRAKATDPNALAEDVSGFLNFASKYLEFQRAFGTENSYQAIYDAVVGDVEGLKEGKNLTLEMAQLQLDELKKIAENTSNTMSEDAKRILSRDTLISQASKNYNDIIDNSSEYANAIKTGATQEDRDIYNTFAAKLTDAYYKEIDRINDYVFSNLMPVPESSDAGVVGSMASIGYDKYVRDEAEKAEAIKQERISSLVSQLNELLKTPSIYLSTISDYISQAQASMLIKQRELDLKMALFDLGALEVKPPTYEEYTTQQTIIQKAAEVAAQVEAQRIANLNAFWNVMGGSLDGNASGGLTSGLSFAGEIGPEWVVPTYEPQRSSFLKSVGVDSPSIARDISRYIQLSSNGTDEGKEIIIHNYITLDGKEVAKNVAKYIYRSSELTEAIRGAVN